MGASDDWKEDYQFTRLQRSLAKESLRAEPQRARKFALLMDLDPGDVPIQEMAHTKWARFE
jgi:hypothetical protein